MSFFLSLFFSVQEVDPLYIAYADMMAKVFFAVVLLNHLLKLNLKILLSSA